MKNIFLDPVFSIILAQALVAWSFCASHWGTEKVAKIVTLCLAIPVTCILIYVSALRVTVDQSEKNKQNDLIASVELQAKSTLTKILKIDDSVSALNKNIELVNGHIEKVGNDLVGTYEKEKENIENLNKILKKELSEIGHSNEVIKSTVNDLANNRLQQLTTVIGQAMNNIQYGVGKVLEVESSVLQQQVKRNRATKKYLECIEEQKEQYRLAPGIIMSPCEFDPE
ncbi:hypothetical protein DesfrDRAFT_0809 [Solidesulfovibrio fructosivorans JJ]]|uniref:Uncharacterized protein n=1 Tax=Solidesulfovibrio fructosivorans JJ] TaxID=596151 RepID=E1JT60_SOLFR|nr:hypothetical protein [Solidesulfovibrio fructosivorans]EFL52320.1 hypothetical protein DesfrDRAFT_0809 [Solidesulfovibrio fructosivorans JJ]]